MHLEVVYNATPPPQTSPQEFARLLNTLQKDNCSFKKVQILPHNIGYLKLDAFLDPSVCDSTATAAMASLNHADALIFDLRDNRGGTAEMVSLISSYLFDHPEYMFDPRRVPTPQSWTSSPVPGQQTREQASLHPHLVHYHPRCGAIHLRPENVKARHHRRRNHRWRRPRWRMASHRRSLRNGHPRKPRRQSVFEIRLGSNRSPTRHQSRRHRRPPNRPSTSPIPTPEKIRFLFALWEPRLNRQRTSVYQSGQFSVCINSPKILKTANVTAQV